MRATGKTYRAVLRALADASEGKFVVFVGRGYPDHARRYAYDLTLPLHNCVFFNQAKSELTFREPPDGLKTIGTLRFRFTYLEAFERDVRGGRYSGFDRTKLKVVFDDCGPDAYTYLFLQERANG